MYLHACAGRYCLFSSATFWLNVAFVLINHFIHCEDTVFVVLEPDSGVSARTRIPHTDQVEFILHLLIEALAESLHILRPIHVN